MKAEELLPGLLATAVMMRLAELQCLDDTTFLQRCTEWREGAEAAGVFSEDILFRSPTPGATAAAFNGLAKAIASLAFVPAGITMFGEHWEAVRGESFQETWARSIAGRPLPPAPPPPAPPKATHCASCGVELAAAQYVYCANCLPLAGMFAAI